LFEITTFQNQDGFYSAYDICLIYNWI